MVDSSEAMEYIPARRECSRLPKAICERGTLEANHRHGPVLLVETIASGLAIARHHDCLSSVRN